MGKAKYVKCHKIENIIMFAYAYRSKLPIYHRHKVMTFGWYQNWSFRYVDDALKRGYLFYAQRKDAV